MVLFDNQALKERIKNCAANCLNELYRLMPDLMLRRAKELLETLNEFNQKIAIPPASVEQFVA